MGEAIINFIALYIKEKTGAADIDDLNQIDYDELIKYLDTITRR